MELTWDYGYQPGSLAGTKYIAIAAVSTVVGDFCSAMCRVTSPASAGLLFTVVQCTLTIYPINS